MNRAAEVVNNEYGTYKTRRRRETYNGNGKNQSGAAARYALRGKQCGVVHRLFYSFYRCRRMFANFYSSGVRAGKNTDAYSEAHKHYDELKKIVVDCKMQGRLTEFCRYYIDDELESARTAILTEVGISYSDYQKEYCGKDKKTLQKNEKLSVVQIAAILRANKTKPVKLTPEMILKRGRGSASRSPLGVKPETKRALTFGSKFCTTCITSVLTGVIMLDVIVNPTWATFAACCLKLLPIFLNGMIILRFRR